MTNFLFHQFSIRIRERMNLLQKDDNDICLQKYEIMYCVCLAILLDCVSHEHNQQN